jgi:CRP-like cAMP-binding protein
MITIMSDMLVSRLSELAGPEQRLAADDILFRVGDKVRSLFLVVAGAVRLTRPLPNGFQLILQRAGAGTVLAEASLFVDSYHCEGMAAEDAVVRAVPVRRLEEALAERSSACTCLDAPLGAGGAEGASQFRLSLRTVTARVDAWVALNHGALPPKGQWRQVASEIGITPEALYRELARRRQTLGSAPKAHV